MGKPTGPTNQHTQQLIQDLQALSRTEKVQLWKRIAQDLVKSRRSRREVTIYKLNQHTKANETIIVPGKVIGNDTPKHTLKVAALAFSATAQDKLKGITIQELMKENPKGKGVRIIG